MINQLKRKRWKYAIAGSVMSFIGPLGEWLVINFFFDSVDDTLVITLIYIEILCLLLFTTFGYVIGSYAEKIEALAFRDQLTGLYNRHYVFEKLKELLGQFNRYQTGFSVMMLDLDKFKSVNDQHGHIIGDKTLAAVAEALSAELRSADFAGRYGGEEFIVICPSTNANECYELAERIRHAVSSISAESLGYPGPQTISVGVLEVSCNEASKRVSHEADHSTNNTTENRADWVLAELLKNADLALYSAKTSGRNKVVVYQELQNTASI